MGLWRLRPAQQGGYVLAQWLDDPSPPEVVFHQHGYVDHFALSRDDGAVVLTFSDHRVENGRLFTARPATQGTVPGLVHPSLPQDPVTPIVAEPDGPKGVTVCDGVIAWSTELDRGRGPLGAVRRAVQRADGSVEVDTVARGQSNPLSVQWRDAQLWWAERGGGRIWRASPG